MTQENAPKMKSHTDFVEQTIDKVEIIGYSVP